MLPLGKVSRDITYTIELPLDSGINYFQLNIPEESMHLELYSQTDLSFEEYRKKDFIEFSKRTSYIIRDEKGNYVQSGNVPFINIKRLPKGVYYINIDSKKITKFIK